MTVTSLSVGQGESILISRQGEGHYLVDGGGLRSPGFDVGERLVGPALASLGVRSLRAVILTHNHPDHSQGLHYILEHIPVQEFWSAIPRQKLPKSLRKTLQQKHIPVVLIQNGWTTKNKSLQGELALFAPCQNTTSINDRSLVLYARYGCDSVLLTGDLEENGVKNFLEHLPPPAEATLLKLPHHGSRKSIPQHLVASMNAQIAFASLGKGNPYGFPSQEAQVYLKKRKIPFYRTDIHGTLRFNSQGRGWTVRQYEKGLFH